MGPDWYFHFDGFSGRPTADIPTDTGMPLPPSKLRSLGVPDQNAFDWQDQYCFIPSVIIFNPREYRQQIKDPAIRLPFLCSGESAHGGYGDVTVCSSTPLPD
jgi:hypothetical protein